MDQAPLLGEYESGRVSSTTMSDDEHYGCPSDEEAPRGKPRTTSSACATPAEDDAPLMHADGRGTASAVHERIIREEKARQNDKTLEILEGRRAPIQRSRTLPHCRRPRPPPQRPTQRPPPPPPPYDAVAQSPRHVISRRVITAPVPDLHTAMTQRPLHGSQTRVFLQTVQRYKLVPLNELTLTWHVMHFVQAQGALPPLPGAHNTWAMYDVIPDLGMERPIRDYERLEEVVKARGTSGYFLIKPIEWPELLRSDAIPTYSSVLGGYVHVALDGRNWTRWWLELREHAMFLAKSETSRPEVCVCTLLDVDVYMVDRQRVPKGYGFALRAQTESRTVLLAAQSNEAAHHDWIKSLFRARSYVLCQERPDVLASAHSLERAEQRAASDRRAKNLRKQAALQRSKSVGKQHTQGPLIQSDAFDVPFQKGSLLATMPTTTAGR